MPYLFSLNDTCQFDGYICRARGEEEEGKERERAIEEKKKTPKFIGRDIDVFSCYFRSDLIGCMSFNMKTLLKTTSCAKVRKSIKARCERLV